MPTGPVQYLPSLLQIRAQYDVDAVTGEHPENVLWFVNRSAGTPTLAQLTTIAQTFDAAWAPVFAAAGSTVYHYTGSIVTDWSSAFGLVWTTVGTYTPHAGGAGGVALPFNSSALISLKTGEHFKGGHFRIYLPYLAANDLGTNPSWLSSTAISAIQSAFTGVEPAMNSSGVLGGQSQRCYRHRYDPVNKRVDPITVFTVNQMIATQRRRLRKAPHK